MSGKSTRKQTPEARRRPSRGRADLSRLRRVSDAEIRRTSPSELADLPANFWDDAEVVAPTSKRAISLRLDEDVLDWFRRSGPRYQTRMNAVLRIYVKRMKSHAWWPTAQPGHPVGVRRGGPDPRTAPATGWRVGKRRAARRGSTVPAHGRVG